AAEARVVVEQRTEAGRRLPLEVERALAGLELLLLIHREVRGRVLVPELRAVVDRRRAAQSILAGGVIATRREREHEQPSRHAAEDTLARPILDDVVRDRAA